MAEKLVADLTRAGQTLAAAESLTGGLVCAQITAIPGASLVLRGGVVAYIPEIKTALVDVSAELIETAGVVSREVAEAMAIGARRRFGADWGVGTTGAAGPESHGGQPPGTVWIAVAGPGGPPIARHLILPGDREAVRQDTVERVLVLLADRLDLGAKLSLA